MSVSVQHVAQAQLSADEAAFLRERAFPLWYDHEAFAEAEVDRAKALFRRVFGLDEAQPLQGFLFQDALAMNPPEDRTRYFAMMLVAPSSSSSSSGGGEEEQSAKKLVWLRAVVTIDTFQFAPERLSFHEFLAILSTYRNRDGPAYPSTSSDGGATPPPSSCCTTTMRQLSRRALMMMTMLAEESDEEDEEEDDEEQDEDTKTS